MRGEGHFAAELIKEGFAERTERKPQKLANTDFIEIYRKFENENLNIKLEGEFISFGDFLYMLPKGIGTLDKIKCIRAGLMLGDIRKGRFVPAHHLCMSLKKEDFKRTISFNENDIEFYKQGGSVAAISEKGYGAALYRDKFPIGWYKYSDGVAKNHYPKYLRG